VRRALAGDFEVEREIGRGRTAVVYLARDVRLRHRIALKVLRPDRADTDAADRLLEAARTTAMLEHPNVLPVYAAGEHGGIRFVATRHVHGCSLDRLARAGERLPAAMACHVAAQIAGALEFAHAAGVVHGDLRPEHVLLDGTWGQAVVTGFGAPGPAGDRAYAAPELADGAPPTPASDQYALGALAWELLAGAPPVAPPDPAGGGEVTPVGLRVALARMLALAPEARWPRLGDVVAVLARHAGSELAQQKELRRRVAALAPVPAAPSATPAPPTVAQPPRPAVEAPPSRPTADPQPARPTLAEPPAPRPVAVEPPAQPRPAPPVRASRYAAASEVRDIELPFRGDDARATPAAAPAAAAAPRRRSRRPAMAAAVAAVTVAAVAAGAVIVPAVRGRGRARPAPTPPPAPRPPLESSPSRAPAGAIADRPTGAPLQAVGEGETAAPDSAAPVVRLVVLGAVDSLAVGDSVRLRVALVDADGARLPRPAAARVRWRSADSARVQVSPTGWARATLSGGPVVVTAQLGDARGRTRLRVVPAPTATVAAAPEPPAAEPPGPSAAESEALVERFVGALRARELDAVRRLLEAGGAPSAADAARWLRDRRDFRATLAELGAARDAGEVHTVEFRVTLAWKTRSLADLHRGGTTHAESAAFRATLARDAEGWTLRGVTPVDRFPP
jgi:serine/threonine-protein kinase